MVLNFDGNKTNFCGLPTRLANTNCEEVTSLGKRLASRCGQNGLYGINRQYTEPPILEGPVGGQTCPSGGIINRSA